MKIDIEKNMDQLKEANEQQRVSPVYAKNERH